MATFHISQQDVLIMSVAVNICVLLHLLMDKVVTWLAPILSNRSSMVRTLWDLHQKRPGLFARMLMEQMTFGALIVMILIALSYTSVSIQPFSYQPLPYPNFLIKTILASSIARFIVIAVRIALIKDSAMAQHRIPGSAGQTDHPKLDFFYNLFSATTNFVWLAFHENLLIGVTSSFMEVSSTSNECCKLIELARKSAGSDSYRKTTILNCVLCFVFRAAMPLFFLILASTQESPFVMDSLPLVWLCVSGVVYVVYNTLLLWQSIRRVIRSSSHAEPLSSPCQSSPPQTPFSIHNYPDMLSNDILLDKKPTSEGDHYHLKDFNNGLLRSYDNRNLSGTIDGEDGKAVNVMKKKDTSKYSLLQKVTRGPEGEMLRKFLIHNKVFKNLQRTSSNDILLDSQADVYGKENAAALSDIKTDRKAGTYYDKSCQDHYSNYEADRGDLATPSTPDIDQEETLIQIQTEDRNWPFFKTCKTAPLGCNDLSVGSMYSNNDINVPKKPVENDLLCLSMNIPEHVSESDMQCGIKLETDESGERQKLCRKQKPYTQQGRNFVFSETNLDSISCPKYSVAETSLQLSADSGEFSQST